MIINFRLIIRSQCIINSLNVDDTEKYNVSLLSSTYLETKDKEVNIFNLKRNGSITHSHVKIITSQALALIKRLCLKLVKGTTPPH